MLLEPKEIQVDGKTFIVSKLPATVAVEIMMRSAGNAIPKAGDFAIIESMMLKTMCYVAIRRPNIPDLMLNSRELIDNHCPNWTTYMKVLEEMRGYNNLFLVSENLLTFLERVMAMLPARIRAILTPDLQPLSTQNSPPSTS